MHKRKFLTVLGLSFLGLAAVCQAESAGKSMEITDLGGKLRVQIDGKLFTEYFYQGALRPYLYPILGPNDLPMTRNWPMKEAENEERDHPHHKSLWFTHGDVNGIDFWADGQNKGKIVHDKFVEIKTETQSGKSVGIIREKNRWVSPAGKLVCTEDRTVQIQKQDGLKMVDFVITMHASEWDLKFGDTKEGSMGIRLAETMRLKGKVGKGHIVNSEGVRDDKTWGKRAKWCDYYGPVNGQIVGVAFFDHPQNPRYPTWWHVRDYGLFAANPFGLHDFEKKPAGAGDLLVKKGESVTFRYRLIFHPGNDQEANVEKLFQQYVKETSAK